jgi:hypothetical protein
VTDATTTLSGPRAALRRDPGSLAGPAPASLVDVLERVLDKGIVIAGDIRVNLLDIELLTIKVRLLIASVDRAREMGIDWWEHDPTLSGRAGNLADENRELRSRIAELESRSPDTSPEDADSDREGNG